jgi:hypothetical protein
MQCQFSGKGRLLDFHAFAVALHHSVNTYNDGYRSRQLAKVAQGLKQEKSAEKHGFLTGFPSCVIIRLS